MGTKAKVAKVAEVDYLSNDLLISDDCNLDLSLIDDLDDVLEIYIMYKSLWAKENRDFDIYLINRFKANVYEIKLIEIDKKECIYSFTINKEFKYDSPVYIGQLESAADLYWLDIEEWILNCPIIELRLDYELRNNLREFGDFIVNLGQASLAGISTGGLHTRFTYAFKLADLWTCIAKKEIPSNLFKESCSKKINVNRRKFNKSIKSVNKHCKKVTRKVVTEIYLITDRQANVCKIGISKNASERLKGLQTSYPYPLELEYSFEGNLEDEQNLHEKFAQYRLSGEWFTFNDEILDYFESRRET